ncbi:MAG: DUF5985 family protein [Hyphomicrobiaceae bacterium]
MAGIVYFLCALGAAGCAILLLHSYKRSRYRLLLWSGLCFTGLTLNNLLLVLDKLVVQDFDMSMWRSGVTLVSMCILLFGLVWDTE